MSKPITKGEIRRGTYYDSAHLMQLQKTLASSPGVLEAGVFMGTDANKELLAQSGLLTAEAEQAMAEDLVIVVRTVSDAAAEQTLALVDELLIRRRQAIEQEYRPKSLRSAAQMMPDAQWVLISVPGRYAGSVAREALRMGKNIFLYSDNVSLEAEMELKQTAVRKGLLVMGADCGTAIVGGVGLGFANRVRRGPIGLVGSSGTGLQQVAVRVHELGSGIAHAIGTGGRDLSERVGGVTTRQGLDLLGRDPETQVIVLVSKPLSPSVADGLLKTAGETGKPVVVDFVGHSFHGYTRRRDNLYFTASLDEAAELAVRLVTPSPEDPAIPFLDPARFASSQRYLRGLFSGGTLAYEALFILQEYLPCVYSNIPLSEDHRLTNVAVSQGHTVLDLGEDEFTVGRLHPMMDNDLRIRRLHQEADDPEVAVILIDVVLGYGAHPDPASELAPAIASARAKAEEAGRRLEVVAVVVGTEEDPQGFDAQVERLNEAGALVKNSNQAAVRYVGRLVQTLNRPPDLSPAEPLKSVSLAVLTHPLVAINVGLEVFAESLMAQDARVIQVDWQPPARGNEQLMAILERMRGGGQDVER